MPRVIFKFDKEKDLWNSWHKSNWNPSFQTNFDIDPNIIKICKGKSFEECKEKLSSHLKKLHNSPLIKIYMNALENSWRLIGDEFFKRMDKLMKREFDSEITAYLTTLGICPYNPEGPSFMISFYYSLPRALSTCGHEIMHLYFHKFYWDKVQKEIGKEKTGDLKEALTVLLNPEFSDLWFIWDNGYEVHKELRKFILEQWKKEKDFDKLLSSCIKYLKRD